MDNHHFKDYDRVYLSQYKGDRLVWTYELSMKTFKVMGEPYIGIYLNGAFVEFQPMPEGATAKSMWNELRDTFPVEEYKRYIPKRK